MYLIAETILNALERLKNEFKPTKTLTDKNLLIAMMYQPWELCDDVFTKWTEASEMTLSAKKTLRAVVAEHLYSDGVYIYCGS